MADAWTVEGVELPEGFDFPITKLGTTSDIHGEGAFVNTSPTRVKCRVHVEARPKSPEGSARLEILPSPLHPDRGTELEVAYEFERQFSLALWLYRGLPSRIVSRPGHQRAPVTWSLRGQALATFLQFSQALLDFHDDRQAYFFARHVAPRERGRRAADADIEFLLLMMSMEVLFTTDGRPGLSDRLAKRCALLNGRDSGERKTIRGELYGPLQAS